MGVNGDDAQVLITVKATPQPSKSYGDTVCVAGLRVDSATPQWVRLYPVPFRWLDGEMQFSKYALVDVQIARRHKDTRPESYTPDVMSIKVGQTLPAGPRRHDYLGKVEPTTTCELSRAADDRHDAPSLGLVYPSDVERLTFERHSPWTSDQIATMRAKASAESTALFAAGGPVPKTLVAPRLKASYKYRCGGSTCRGHTGRILDWELTAFQNRHRQYSESELKAAIEHKFLDQMFAADRKPGFYMGNFEDPRKRHSFSVLGVYWPKAVDARAVPQTLF